MNKGICMPPRINLVDRGINFSSSNCRIHELFMNMYVFGHTYYYIDYEHIIYYIIMNTYVIVVGRWYYYIDSTAIVLSCSYL